MPRYLVALAVLTLGACQAASDDVCDREGRYGDGVCDLDCPHRDVDCDAYVPPNLPPDPTNVEASSGLIGHILVTWDVDASVEGYRVYGGWGADVDFSAPRYEESGAGMVGSFADYDVIGDNCYSYVVRGYDAGGESPGVHVSGCAGASFAGPTGLVATPTSSSTIELSWDATSGAVAYEVFRSAGGGTFWSQGGRQSGTAWTDSAALSGTYAYYVIAYDAADRSSAPSSVAEATTSGLPPASPAGVQIVDDPSDGPTLQWNDVADASAFNVYRGDASGGPFALFDSTYLAWYVLSGAPAGLTSYFYVTSTSAAGESAPSATVSITLPPAALAAPTSENLTSASVLIRWEATTGATSYDVYRRVGSSGSYGLRAGDLGGLVFGDDFVSVAYGEAVSYYVVAKGAGGASSPSPTLDLVVPYPLDPPANLLASDTVVDSIELSWDAVVGAETYDVYRSTSTFDVGTRVATGVTTTSYVDLPPTVSDPYLYRVRALATGGLLSNLSDPATGTAMRLVSPSPFWLIALPITSTPSDYYVRVNWTAVTGAVGYKIYRAPESGGCPTTGYVDVSGLVGGTTYDDTPPAANVLYCYRAVALSTRGFESYATGVLAESVSYLLAPPSGVAASIDQVEQVSVSWSAVSGASTYRVYRATAWDGPYAQVGPDVVATTYVDGSVVPEVYYYYEVRAFGAGGEESAASIWDVGMALYFQTHQLVVGYVAPTSIVDGLGMAVDAADNLYIVDDSVGPSFATRGVHEFSPTGVHLLQIGSHGAADGEFNAPLDVAIGPTGMIYVSDTHTDLVDRDRVQIFTALGVYDSYFGAHGSGDAQFIWPTGVAIDADDNAFVVDYGNDRIVKFDAAGAFLTAWGHTGTGAGDGELALPWYVALDSTGALYVTDMGNDRVQKFANDGTYLLQFSAGAYWAPRAIAVGPDDTVYVAGSTNVEARVRRYDSAGNFLGLFGKFGTAVGELNYVQSLAVDSQGDVYVLEGDSRLQKFEPIP